jgi:hypothetical protein
MMILVTHVGHTMGMGIKGKLILVGFGCVPVLVLVMVVVVVDDGLRHTPPDAALHIALVHTPDVQSSPVIQQNPPGILPLTTPNPPYLHELVHREGHDGLELVHTPLEHVPAQSRSVIQQYPTSDCPSPIFSIPPTQPVCDVHTPAGHNPVIQSAPVRQQSPGTPCPGLGSGQCVGVGVAIVVVVGVTVMLPPVHI